MTFNDSPYVPESKEEERLMKDIHVATRRAHEDGLEKRDIARLLAFMASATLDSRSMEESPERSESGLEEEMSDPTTCPECGGPVARSILAMGGDVQCLPCNCIVQYEDLSEEEREELGLEE